MRRYRVFIESVEDADNPALLTCLVRFSHRDRAAVRVMLGNLPAPLADGVDAESAARLTDLLAPLGCRLFLKPHTVPKTTELEGPRALSLYHHLAWAWAVLGQTWGRQLLLFFALGFLMLAAQVAVALGVAALQGVDLFSGETLPLRDLLQLPLVWVAILAIQLLALLAGFWYISGLMRLIDAFMEEGGRGSLGVVMGDAWRRTPELITGVGLMVAPLLPLLTVVGINLDDWFAGSAGQGPIMLSLFLLLLVVILMFGFVLAGPALVYETLSPWSGLRRGWLLSAGRRLRLVGHLSVLCLGVLALGFGGHELGRHIHVSALIAPPWGVLADVLLGTVFRLALLLLTLYALAFTLNAFYFEARILEEGWRPAWAVVPHSSWPASHGDPMRVRGRGLRAWLELLIHALVWLLLLMVVLFHLSGRIPDLPSLQKLQQELAGWVAESQPATKQARAEALPGGIQVSLVRQKYTGKAGDHAQLSIDVRLSGLQAIPLGFETGRLLAIRFRDVLDAAGNALINPAKSLMLGSADVHLSLDHSGGLTGRRILSYPIVAQAPAIETVQGDLQLRIPEGLRALVFEHAGGEPQGYAGLTASLRELAGKEARVVVIGHGAGFRVFGMAARSIHGDWMAAESLSTDSAQGWVRLHGGFREPVDQVRVYLAKGITEVRQEFLLQGLEPILLGAKE